MRLTGAELLIRSLLDQGTEIVFGYPGGTILEIYDILFKYRDDLRHIVTSHEQGAAHAADGYARATGRVGVVLSTSGPGATNLVTGIATAHHDSVPMVAITGNVTQELIGRDGFQEVDIIGISNPIVKHNYMLKNVADIPSVIRNAFIIASSGRKGPVLVDIPKDVLCAEAEYYPAPLYEPRIPPRPLPYELDEARELITQSQRPMILAGGGVIGERAPELLLELSEKLLAPVCTTLTGLPAVPEDYPLGLGLIGLHGTYTASVAANTCDLMIAVGTRFSDRVVRDFRNFIDNARILHIDIDESEISKNVRADCFLVGDAAEILSEINDRLSPVAERSWTQKLLTIRERHPLPPQSAFSPDAREIITRACRLCPDDYIIVTDVGQHQLLTAQYGIFASPRGFISSCGLGTMGYGLGAAIGAAAGCPHKRVILITGDGGLHMNIGELAVAVSEHMPIVIIVMNNKSLGMVYQWQLSGFEGRSSYTELDRRTDFAAAARAFGAYGLKIEKSEDTEAVLAEAFSHKDAPTVVECLISKEQMVEKLNL